MKPPPLVEPDQPLSDGYRITLPFPMARRVEDVGLLFWHKPRGLSFYIRWSACSEDEGDPVERWRDMRSMGGYDEITEHAGKVVRYGYRLDTNGDDGGQPAFYGLVADRTREFLLGGYFDSEEDFPAVLDTWRSIRAGASRLN